MSELGAELPRDHAAIEWLSHRLSRLIDSGAEPALLAEARAQLARLWRAALDA